MPVQIQSAPFSSKCQNCAVLPVVVSQLHVERIHHGGYLHNVAPPRSSLRLKRRLAQFNTTMFELQNVSCTLIGSAEDSSFSMAFRQGTTDLISGNASLLEFEEALESMATIGDVEVS